MHNLKLTVPESGRAPAGNTLLFWKQQLQGAAPILELPADYPRTTQTADQQNYLSFPLSAFSYGQLKQLRTRLSTTPGVISLAAFNTLLFRYTKQEDIVIGGPVIKNIIGEAGQLTGSIRHVRIYRTDLSGDPSFEDLLKRVDKVFAGVRKQEDGPYQKLEELVKSENDSIQAPLFNVIFSFAGGLLENSARTGLVLARLVANTFYPAADLGLHIEETGETMDMVWSYNSSLYDAAAIVRFAKHFEILLESIAGNPHERISHLQLFSTQEIKQLPLEWSSCNVTFPAEKCIHHLIEEQVTKTPEAVAVIFEKKQLTYKELNDASNRLAHYLRSKGVTQETLVPICMERSAEMIIGMIGILKAGGAYVPIDPDYPAERISFLLEDTKATIVVCSKDSKGKLKQFEKNCVIALDDDASFLKGQPVDNPNIGLSSDNLAYVIYTSGSTGKPKGVMIEHRSLVDHCYGVIESAGLKPCKSFALFSPLVFDAGHSIIHSSLILGASLHVLSKETILDSEKIAGYLNTHSVDCIKIVPSLWLSYANLQQFVLAKRVMIFGGEAFSPGILTYLTKLRYSGDVYNHYGPTEVTIGKCIHKVDLAKTYRTVPIGKPFSNTQLYILDDQLQLTPVNIEGELYITGEGVARGYLNLPELTQQKFISNPFPDSRFKKIYKTGDKVRWLPDGNIEYLGRADEQIKMQGHRIELGEIESALSASGLVYEAVVLANADERGNKRLVGYVVPMPEFNKQRITAFLREKLPEYMVPLSWISLKQLPLTTNGKIDKKALAAHDVHDIADHPYVAPRNATEAALAKIWQKYLGIERIGVDENFFELGGTSIQSVHVVSMIRKKTGKNLSIDTLFRAPTIAQLALYISENKKVEAWSALVPIQPLGSNPPIFCIHAGGGTVQLYRKLSIHLGLNQPMFGMQARGLNGVNLPHSGIEDMAKDYITEIFSVQPSGPYFIAGYCFGGIVAFEIAQQLLTLGHKVALLATFNSRAPTYSGPSNTAVKGMEQRNAPKVENVPGKIAGRFKNFTKLSSKEKMKYVYWRIKIRAELKAKILLHKILIPKIILPFIIGVGVIRRKGHNYYLSRKRPMPAYLGRSFLLYANRGYIKAYKPKTYPGKMIVFRSPKIYTDPDIGWAELVAGGIKTIDIPGKHRDRRAVMEEPYVQVLAHELKKFLN